LHTSGLFLNLFAALAVAFVGAVAAIWLRQSLLLGYIVAGIVIGPHTPGFVADQTAVSELAEIGIVFLLFAVGLDLSLRDLLRVGVVAVVGALVQIAAVMGLAYVVGRAIGWQPIESLFFGAVVAISSSTVMSKILSERGQTDAEHGRIAFAWSTVQDLATIALVVVLSTLAEGGDSLTTDLAWALGQSAVFLALLIPVGLYVLPRLFERVAAFRNREVFVLAVATVALGAAYTSSLFGVSVALGAFVAGIVVGESDLSHQILGEIQPLRDILAGLFFVSIGMLVDPAFVLDHALLVAMVVLLIVPVKGLLSAGLIRLFGVSASTAVLAGATVAQSAEFSFLLATVGASVGAIGPTAFNAMLAGAVISTILAPWLLSGVAPLAGRLDRPSRLDLEPELPVERPQRRRHAIICGYGRVGRVIAEALDRRGLSYVVIEQDPRVVRRLREGGVTALLGNAENPILLEHAHLDLARIVVVAIPDAIAARRIVEQARQARPQLAVVVRTHSLAELTVLRQRGADEAVLGELELALEMTRHTLHRFGVSALETVATVNGLRTRIAQESRRDDPFAL